MTKPIIGIVPTFNSSNQDNNPYQNKSSFVDMYAEKIISSGGIPIGMLTRNIDEYISICDGYLWPGGNKIEWQFLKILEDTIENGKSTLGICLGMQTICTYFTILEDMKEGKSFRSIYNINKIINPYLAVVDNKSMHSHHILNNKKSIDSAKHEIEILEGSILEDIYKTKRRDVVSLHNYCVRRLSKDLFISARSSDNVIEGVEYTKNNCSILGVQFHPEIEDDSRIFDYLVSSCQVNNKGITRKKVTK